MEPTRFVVDAPENAADGPVPAVQVTGYSLINETLMRDKSWAYNRRVYELWRIWDPWPPASLLQISGPTDTGALTQAVWRDQAAEHAYMSKQGAERFTDVVRTLIAEGEHPLADVLPINMALSYVALGPLARGFIDIGADLDESAGLQLGTVLTAVDLDHSALGAQHSAELQEVAGPLDSIPGELIVRLLHTKDDALRETQVWASEGAARGFLEGRYLPEAERIAGRPDAVDVTPRVIKRLAISSHGVDPARFG